jgi:energy-converting hydrogenase Eha subunit H
MVVTLGGIDLPMHLVMDGIETAPPIASSQARTLSGASVLRSLPLIGGRTLSLTSDGVLTLAQVSQIQALAQAGQKVTLSHHRGQFAVIVIGIAATARLAYANPDAATPYDATITMIEV